MSSPFASIDADRAAEASCSSDLPSKQWPWNQSFTGPLSSRLQTIRQQTTTCCVGPVKWIPPIGELLNLFAPKDSKELAPAETAASLEDTVDLNSLFALLAEQVAPYFSVLRVFKTGRLLTEETYIIALGGGRRVALGSVGASMMTVDYGMISIRDG